MGRMGLMARNEYLKVLIRDYLGRGKKEKGEVLNEYCKNTGQNRKYVIRKIRHILLKGARVKRKRRAKRYGKDVERGLVKLWEIFDNPCGQRLTPLLESEVDRLIAAGELHVSESVREKLKEVSSATIDRMLESHRNALLYRRRKGSRKGGLLHKRIPMKMTDWDTAKVGYVEVDLVNHCGASTQGEYVNTLSVVEISSGWWEGEAIMGKGQYPTFQGLSEIRERSPFAWLGVDSDNESAFINHHLDSYCTSEGLEFTRSRPYRKNDNAYIEQKNYTHVRRPLGYLRYDTEEELSIIRALHRNELRMYKNFFQPVMKLLRKERVNGKIKRIYDKPKTPHNRLIESGQVSKEREEELRETYLSLNPAELKRRIDRKLSELIRLYDRKRKKRITINPYKKLRPISVTY